MGRIRAFISGARLDSSSPPPYLLKTRSSKIFILSTICIAVFTDIFLYGIIVPVIPFALSSRAGVAESSVQSWVSVLLAVYGAALLVSSPFAGWYADRSSSRRLPLLFGLLALGGATVMLCLARTVALLVLGRILQGFSAAIVWTVGQALLVDTVGQKEIGQTLGWVSLSMTLGILVAPLIGGVVYNKVIDISHCPVHKLYAENCANLGRILCCLLHGFRVGCFRYPSSLRIDRKEDCPPMGYEQPE